MGWKSGFVMVVGLLGKYTLEPIVVPRALLIKRTHFQGEREWYFDLAGVLIAGSFAWFSYTSFRLDFLSKLECMY